MIKVLAIGNSFSQDATTFLHGIAAAGNIETRIVNLCIGGCSLSTHWENVEQNASNYEYQLNGVNSAGKISIKDALLEDKWNFVTLQQSSPLSGVAESYYPYITRLSGYVRDCAPGAAQFIHETWAYETDSGHEAFAKYRHSQKIMYKALEAAYRKAAKTLGLPVIPSGKVIQKLRKLPSFNYPGGQSLCRDGYHLHLIYGRYAAAAAWYETVLGGNILGNSFIPRDPEIKETVRDDLLRLIQQTVHKVCR